MYTVLKKATITAGLTGNKALFEKAITLADKKLKDRGMAVDRLQMTYAESRKDWDAYASSALHYFGQYTITQPKELDHAASIFARHISDSGLLETAANWARQSIALENEIYNNETYALLMFKLKQYQEARKYANRLFR